MTKKISPNDYRLLRRYLLWCYKTTKEELDRVDRYFTQNIVDDHMLGHLIKAPEFQSSSGNSGFKKSVQVFEEYKIAKLQKATVKKFTANRELQPEYLYLVRRLEAIESAVMEFLGDKEWQKIIDLYEQEMTQRILTARGEHT
ncbi:MAG: hypothetical protein K8I00_06485 [Candidatus Omnitrophica bacterium]|nr:hypothetical protein [Candidatus Omnitrophota bacterium]